jgi:hypothetical protein
MIDLVHAQTILTTDELTLLKQKTNNQSTKDAIRIAILKYLEKNNDTQTTMQKRT